MPAAKRTFIATIEEVEGGSASGSTGFVRVPEAVLSALGARKRMPVVVTIRGVSYRSTTSVYGGEFFLPVRAEIRAKAAVTIGSRVRVGVERDDMPREVEIPKDVARALRAARLLAYFEATSFSHRREHVQWVEQAKRPETRERRIAKLVDVLGTKSKEPARR